MLSQFRAVAASGHVRCVGVVPRKSGAKIGATDTTGSAPARCETQALLTICAPESKMSPNEETVSVPSVAAPGRRCLDRDAEKLGDLLGGERPSCSSCSDASREPRAFLAPHRLASRGLARPRPEEILSATNKSRVEAVSPRAGARTPLGRISHIRQRLFCMVV